MRPFGIAVAVRFIHRAAFCEGSAYILVGIPGIGYGQGLGVLQGVWRQRSDSSLCIPLTITAGNVPGINATAITFGSEHHHKYPAAAG